MAGEVAYIGGAGTGKPTWVSSANPLPVTSGGGAGPAPYSATALGYQQISAATLATAQSLTVPATATFAWITCETGNVRWRDDGTAPTASVGMPIYAGQPPQLFSGDLATAKFILSTAGAILDVSYYK